MGSKASRKTLTLAPIADLTPLTRSGELVAFGAGPDGAVYGAFALKPTGYCAVAPNGVGFAKTTPTVPQHYRVFAVRDGEPFWDVVVRDERFNIHFAQPLPDGEFLLACARSAYRGPKDFDRNGRVYAADGALIREILLGDGIASVQTTTDGTIWTSYFDEGVFGNFGWNDPVGATGLVAWDVFGKKIFELTDTGRSDRVCDCYALNVASKDDVWAYYYTDFPLVRLHRRKAAGSWKMPLAGSGAFAVSHDLALFRGGYRDLKVYHFFRLDDGGGVDLLARIVLSDARRRTIVADEVVGRGSSLYLRRGTEVFRLDVSDALG